MIGQGYGRIINLSSQAGFVALPTESVYCISKAAVAHLTRCLAVEWGRHGITVNAVAPTFIRTDGTAADLADPAFEADVVERIAGVHRIGEPMDVAGAVVFLASPAAALITGTTLLIDGGWTARVSEGDVTEAERPVAARARSSAADGVARPAGRPRRDAAASCAARASCSPSSS